MTGSERRRSDDNDTVDARTVDAGAAAGGAAPASGAATREGRWVVAGRYEILGLLGAGGMGSVYRARDRELDEVVALKMVSGRLATSADALERFRREVKLARRVTHKNVARTFDLGEHAGAPFMTMELVEGELLGALLARRRRLPFDEVVRIAKDLCAALAAAHDAGVLHRDLKPENVVIATDGRAVVTDFGIARAIEEGASSQTAAGVLVGTPAYMAPEQIDGTLDLDARADVYALGTMLFELLTGDLPWADESIARATLARLRDEPPDVRSRRPGLSEGIAAVVRKCMARRREDRYSSAAEVSLALDGLVAPVESARSLLPPPARGVARAKLAVLSPKVASERAHAYLAETLAVDLIDELSGLPDLQVKSRAETFRFDVEPDARAAGRALGVDAVVEGTLSVVGGRMQIALRLVTVEDGFQLWARRFERAVTELTEVADEASKAIAEALTTKIEPSRALPVHPVAHDLYLRGRYSYLRGWYDVDGEAVDLLGQAHRLAPGNARFAATYARALARTYGVDARGESNALAAIEVAQKSLAIEPDLAEARAALAMIHLYRGEGVTAANEVVRALACDPEDTGALELAGRLRLEVGPIESAVKLTAAALEHEPNFNEARYTLARASATLRRWDDCREALGRRPDDARSVLPYLLLRIRFLIWERNTAEIEAIARSIAGIEGVGEPFERVLLDLLLAVGLHGQVGAREQEVLDGLFPTDARVAQRRASFNAQIRAELYMAAGDVDAALRALVDADANALLDVVWLDSCALFDDVRDRETFASVRRGTALRAARIRDALDALVPPSP